VKYVSVRDYFPFVEPDSNSTSTVSSAAEKDVPCASRSGWVELLPCGLIHPNVLRSGGINPDEYSGFAFGLGLNRLVMMRYGITDIRHFLSGDIRYPETILTENSNVAFA
jgi:phenylalanyl-tRNA synthetase alpha chain